MNALARFAEWFIREPRVVSGRDRFDIAVVSPSPERFSVARLPFELRYACIRVPDADVRIRALLERGIGLGVRTMPRASESTIAAVERISRSQERTLEPWCSRLIYHEEIPVFTDDDIADAHANGDNLYTDAHVLLSERFAMLRIVPVDLDCDGISDTDLAVIAELNRAIEPLSAAYLHARIRLDRRADLPPIARLLASSLLVIAPIAHVLDAWVGGIGRLFAALADDVVRETSELILLRSSGYTSRQLWRQGIVYVPVILLGSVAVLGANLFIGQGAFFTAGLFFGFAAISFPAIRIIQSFAESRSAYASLHRIGKYRTNGLGLTSMAAHEAVSQPDVVGHAFGILFTPLIAASAFRLFPAYVSNGWFLASLSVFDVVVAIGCLAAARSCSRAIFLLRVRPLVASFQRQTSPSPSAPIAEDHEGVSPS